MIIDHIDNAGIYAGLSKNISSALTFFQTTDLGRLAPGKYEIEGESIYAIVDQYTTKQKDAGRLETHHRYIDVQYVVQGMELIGYANTRYLKPEPYEAARDVQLHEGRVDFLLLREGMFAIMMHDDAHMPGIAVDAPQTVKKIVVKVAVE